MSKEFREAIEQQLEFFDKNPKLAKKYVDEFAKRTRGRRMSKELEHLKIIEDWANEHHESKEVWEHSIPVQEALQRLEQIYNADPSETMKCLESMKNRLVDAKFTIEGTTLYSKDRNLDEDYSTIKNYILKAQEQEKVLSILKEKNIQINSLKKCKTVEEYNILWTTDLLTEEEFDLLKRWQNENGAR